jgi:hypothetical protein
MLGLGCFHEGQERALLRRLAGIVISSKSNTHQSLLQLDSISFAVSEGSIQSGSLISATFCEQK